MSTNTIRDIPDFPSILRAMKIGRQNLLTVNDGRHTQPLYRATDREIVLSLVAIFID
jgi:hypothetical protein